jgi:hypothetical protein
VKLDWQSDVVPVLYMAHRVYVTEDEEVLSWNPDDHDRNRVLQYLVEAGYLRVFRSPSDVRGDRSRYTLTEEGLRVASIELSRLEYDIRGEPGGTYENRMRSVADGLRFDPGDAQDPNILAWWQPAHDDAIRECIRDFQWAWQFRVSRYVLSRVGDDVLRSWFAGDKRLRWNSSKNPHSSAIEQMRSDVEGQLNRFCWARGHEQGFVSAIVPDVWNECALCEEHFRLHSIPDNFLERLGVDQVDFCTPCFSAVNIATRRRSDPDAEEKHLSKSAVCDYVKDLVAVIGRIPAANYGEGVYDFRGLSTAQRLGVFELLRDRKPSRAQINNACGSWFGALISSGVLEGDSQKMGRGIRSLASDGHICHSLGERTIDDLLSAAGIEHTREPGYPEGNFRADFQVGETLIEYFGLAGDPQYDEKTRVKREICTRHGVRLVCLFPQDVVDSAKLLGTLRLAASEREPAG